MYSTQTSTTITAPMTGKCIPLDTFYTPSSILHELGDGLVILPTEGTAVAPFSGRVTRVSQSRRAVVLQADDTDCELILSADYTPADADSFRLAVRAGEHVSAGDTLFTIDSDKLRRDFPTVAVPCIVSNCAALRAACGDAVRGETTVLTCAG